VRSHSIHTGRSLSGRHGSPRSGLLLGALVALAARAAVSHPRALYARAEVWMRGWALLLTAWLTLLFRMGVFYA
jgi:hypothetical protein